MTRAAARARSLLEAQHSALLAGDLTRLAEMPDALQSALALLQREPSAASDMAGLASLAARNAELIRAAQGGLAVLRDRAGRSEPPPLSTYDAGGRRAAQATPGRTLSRG